MLGPWDPNWRPDPTGRRLERMRVARRGALASALIFGSLVAVATMIAWPYGSSVPAAEASLVVALLSLPALALLGAGLTSAALGSRPLAASAGLAIGIGSPVAAVTSAMIGGFILVGLFELDASLGGDVAGTMLRFGVSAAVTIAPLIAIGSVAWVVLVRRFGRSVEEGISEPATVGVPRVRRHGWRRRD